jgi:predicted dehydrogenase
VAAAADPLDFTLRTEDYRPAPPPEHVRQRLGIGIVGCGSIARGAHLPAYRGFGYRVAACCDAVEENARRAAAEFGIPFCTTDLDALLARPDVGVVDLAVHASQRRPLVERIAGAGKPILSQKPFALSMDDAEAMVGICGRAGVPLLINQQARWAPGHAALRRVLDAGVLGHVYSVLHVQRSWQDEPGSWYVQLAHFNLVDHGIHFIDLSRHFTGLTPRRVKAVTARVPGQAAVTPMIHTIALEYAPEAQVMATLHFNNIIAARDAHGGAWYADGTEGSAIVAGNELSLYSRHRPGQRRTFRLQGSWFPDAFGASMGAFMAALAAGREPPTSGRDNLQSIRIAYAAVESAETGGAVAL